MYKERMLGYYPQTVRDIREFKAIVDSEAPEIEDLYDEKDIIIADAYPITMAEGRIEQWEHLLGIQPIEGSSVSDRREAIVARLRGSGKFNTESINSIVNAFTGGSATSSFHDSTLYVIITPPPNNKQYQFENVEQELANRIPAHIGLEVSRNYFSWAEVKTASPTWGDVENDFDTWGDVLLFVPFSS